MNARLVQSDLIAGGVAIAALVLLVYALDASPLLAIPLAGATYAGLALLRPRLDRRREEIAAVARQEQFAYRTALANAAAIRALEPRVVKPSVREQVGRIADKIDRNLTAIREDGNLTAAPIFTNLFLEPYESYLAEYVHLTTRDVKSAGEGLRKFEMHDVPRYEQAVDDFYEQLHRDRVVDLAVLGAVLEFNLESITVASTRRVTP